jgi:DnaJ-class molecular chaperone
MTERQTQHDPWQPDDEDECPKCWGVGTYPFNPHHTCAMCGGTGKKCAALGESEERK